jgi:hypothetical protein
MNGFIEIQHLKFQKKSKKCPFGCVTGPTPKVTKTLRNHMATTSTKLIFGMLKDHAKIFPHAKNEFG